MRDAIGRLQLKSTLLVSAAGLAVAAMSTVAAAADATSASASSPPSDPPKWSPYADIGGGIGSGFTVGKVNVFAPVWQDLDSLLFVRLGADTSTHYNENFNVGLGYRTKINPDWILGVFGGFDSTQASNNHSFTQLSLGAELMSADWDVRINGYSAKKDESAVGNKFALYIHDTTIAILQSQFGAYSGFDGEVGYRVFNTDSTDVRLFAGGYDFSRSSTDNFALGGGAINFSHKDITGARGRAEVNVFNIDALGPQSRVSFDGEIAHDDVRGTTGYVGATLRIALNDLSGGGAQALDDLDRRMVDPVRRQDDVLVRQSFDKPEPVIIYNGHITSQPTNTLYYVDNTAGAGTYANPTTLQDATSRGPVNQFIVLTDRNGPVNSTGVTVLSGESVVGPGTFEVRGVHSGATFSHDFAPGSGPVSLFSTGPNVLTVDSVTNLFGFTINGPFTDAIYGHNITDVVISSVTIDGTAGGVNGIHIVQDVSGDSTININDSTITNVSNDGIYVNNAFSDGGTSNENLHLDNVTISGSGNDGIYVNSNITGGSTANLTTELTSSSISGSGATDVLMSATVGAGSSATQNIIIDPTTITGGLYGVLVNGVADGGTLNQYVDISDTTFSGQTISGLAVFAYGENGGTMNQTVNLTDVTVAGSYFPIAIIANAATGGNVTQNFSLTDVTVTGGTYDGIDIVAHADGVGSVVHQYGTMDGVTVTGTTAGDGVYAYVESTYGATTIAHLTISNLTATGNYDDGLYVGVDATSSTADASTAAQYVSVTNSNLAGNFIGFEADADGDGNATARQDVFVGNTIFSDVAHATPGYEFVGASVDGFAFDGGSVQQNIYFANDTAQGNSASGIAISANSLYTGFVEQNVQIYGTPTTLSEISDNGGYGVVISANATAGGDIEQNVGVYYVDASNNGLGGLAVNTNSYGIAVGYALYYSHVSQNIIAVGDHFDHNGGNGVSVINYAQYGAGIDQFVYIGNSTANNNDSDGIHVESHDIGASYYGYAPGTHLYSDIYVFNTDVDHNGENGISIESDVTMPTDPTKVFGNSYLQQHIVVSGTTANYNANDGFVDNASATGIYSLNLQYITLQNGSQFGYNGRNGAEFTATDYFGPYSFGAVLQEVTVNGATFNNNGIDGIHATMDASGFQGRAEQYFSIFNAIADDNGNNGMSFYSHSHDGAYYPGYTCNYIQGITGGCSIIRQTVVIGYSDISSNAGNGIYVSSRVDNYGSLYAKSGRPLYQSSFFIEDSTVDRNGGDGLHLYNYVANHSYAYQYVVALDTNFNSNTGNGISALNNVTGDSTLVQKFVVYGLGTGPGSEINNNGGAGITIDSQATNGGKIGNLLVVGYSAIDGNAGNGISVTSGADSGVGTADTGVAQYITVLSSDVSGNGISLGGGYGINMNTRATGAYAVTSQYLSLTNSTVNNNGSDGVHAFAIAYGAAAANQTLYFANDTIANNQGDGVYVVGIAVDQSFTTQNVNFGYNATGITNITGNKGDGIYLGTAAFSGANTEQNDFIYHVNASNNGGDGLGIGAGTNGYSFGSAYIYYSHVSQNVIAAYDTFDHNTGNGMSVSNVAYYGGAMNQLIEAVDVDMSYNGGAGFYRTSHVTSIRGNSFSFSTNESTLLYLIGDTVNHNGGNGIDLRSYANGAVYAPAFFGGYNYVQHHDTISGTTASYNLGSGLSVNTSTVGRYSLNAEYLTISGSTFDDNGADGARFVSSDYYGPGGFGVSLQQVAISGSNFSYNEGNGLTVNAFSSGVQGRAEQHFTVTGSNFYGNNGDGVHIYASAINGVYIAGHPCTTVQGLPGGCAFVRQNVTIVDSDISYNNGNGVFVGTYANNYGAIYGVSGRPHQPTVELYGDTVDHNGNRGLDVSNHVSGNSYLYQYIANIDSTFDHNHGDGVYAASYVGGASTMLQRVLLFSYHTGASASYNGSNGFKSTIEALGGSYARDVNIVEGADLSNDVSAGFNGTVSYADGSSTGLQINAVYFNSINFNGDGVDLYSIGAGAQQISYIGDNTITNNAFVGVYGKADFGSFQYIGVYTFGNTVNSNGTDYLFNSFGGSTQILN